MPITDFFRTLVSKVSKAASRALTLSFGKERAESVFTGKRFNGKIEPSQFPQSGEAFVRGTAVE